MKASGKKILLWLHKNAKEVYLPVCVLIVIGITISRIGVKFALQSKIVLDIAVKAEFSKEFYYSIAQLIFLVFFQLGLQSCYTVMSVENTCRLNMNMRERVFNTLMKKNLRQMNNYHTGELLNRIYNDTNVVVNGVMNILPNVISLITRIICVFVALFTLDKTITYVSLVLGPIVLITTRLYSSKMKTLHKKCMESDGVTRSFMLESLQNVLVVKTYKNIGKVTEKSRGFQKINFDYNMKRNYISIVMNIVFYLSVTAGYYIAFSYCALKVAEGIMTVGTLTAVVQLIGQVQSPFKELASCIPQFFSTLASSERLMELYDLEDDNSERVITGKKIGDNGELVDIRNMSFSYDGNEYIFENTDFSLKKGEIVAIGGISGIGKSTLLKIIMGIYTPESGSVDVHIKVRNNAFSSYVPQGNLILSGTIKENIAFFRPIDEEKIVYSAKMAEVLDFINELPEGFDTVLGEKGLGLSEGQVQRLAIARAIYFDAPVLILDEATSALDEKTEYNVLKNIRAMGKTCIIISHKQASFEICDRVIYIENKKIVDKA